MNQAAAANIPAGPNARPWISPWRLALVVGLAASLLHLAYGVWFVTMSPTDMPRASLSLTGEAFLASYPGWGDHEMDAAAHNRVATEIMRTGVPRTKTGALAFHNPLYNYFLAACYAVGGLRLLAVAIPQALLSGAIVALIALTASRLMPRGGATVVGVAGVLVLIYEPLARHTAYMVPTQVVVALFCWGVYLAAAPQPKGRTWAGLTLAMSAAVFAQAAFFVLAGAVVLWLLWEAWRRGEHGPGWAAGMLALAVASKLVLGLARFDGVTADTLRDADREALWIANNPWYENARWTERYRVRFGPAPEWHLSPAQLQRYQEYLARAGGDRSRAGRLYVRENPGQFAKLSFIRMWTGIVAPDGTRWQRRLIAAALWLLIFPAGFYGLWKNRAWPFSKLAWLVILATFAFLTFVHPGSRYRVPADVLLALYAATTYADGYQRWRQRRRAAAAAPVAGA